MEVRAGDVWVRQLPHRAKYLAIDVVEGPTVHGRRVTAKTCGWVYLPNTRSRIGVEAFKRNWSLYERDGQRQGEKNG